MLTTFAFAYTGLKLILRSPLHCASPAENVIGVDVAVLKGRQNYHCRRSRQGFALLGGALMRTADDAAAYDRLFSRAYRDSAISGNEIR